MPGLYNLRQVKYMIKKTFSIPLLTISFLLAVCWLPSSNSSFLNTPNTHGQIAAKNKYIVGHYRNNSLRSSIYEIDDIPAERLTHLIYQSALITENGTVELADRFIDIQKLYLDLDIEKSPYAGNFAKLAQLKKKYPNLKILISIGAWGQSNTYRSITKTPEQRHQLAKSCIDFMEAYGFDGIDIYWQPYEGQIPILDAFQEDRDQFTLFMIELHSQLKRRNENALLSALFKIPAVIHDWPVEKIAGRVDFINLAATYFHGAWEKETNHISSLYAPPGKPSVDSVIQNFVKHKFPVEKIVLDIGTYGQGWQVVHNIQNGLHQPAASASLGSWDIASDYTGLYSQSHVQKIISLPGYNIFWDDKAKTTFAFNPDRFNGHFISFEDKKSLDAKIDYLGSVGLRGIGFLDLHNEKNNKISLLNHIHRRFYFWKEAQLTISEFSVRHYYDHIYFVKIMAIGITLIILSFFYRRKHQQKETKLQAENVSAKDNLLKLEWSLIQLAYLFSFSKNAFYYPQIATLTNPATKLLQAITSITSRSTIRYTNKNPTKEIVNLHAAATSAKIMMASIKKDALIAIEIDKNIITNSDFMLLSQLIYRISQGLLSTQDTHSITIKSFHNENKSGLAFTTNTCLGLSQNDYYALKEAFSSASLLGLHLTFNNHNDGGFLLYIPYEPVNAAIDFFTSKEEKINQLSESSQNIKDKNHQLAEHFSRFNNLIKNEIEKVDFRKDSGSMIEIACNAFLDIHQNISIHVNQSDQHLLSVGNTDLAYPAESVVANDDLSFKIQSQTKLSETDLIIFELLITQIQSIRKALKGITRNSKFLEELHYLSAQHENLLYLQAEDGYTSAYREDQKSPRLISMRLRSIKYFFDDQDYLPIHRSCLVNPNKVRQVVQPHKLKYEIDITSKRLPLSRNYVSYLKTKYPQWFQRMQ
jgi:chitinase